MHCVVILDILCLYLLKSIITFTVIMHSFPFHCHFQTNSIWFSDGLENNKNIYLNKFTIYTQKESNPMLNLCTKENCTTSTLRINCTMKVSVCITIFEVCRTIYMVDNIKINEEIVYLHISVLLFGHTAPMIWIWGYGWHPGCPCIWTNSGPRANN